MGRVAEGRVGKARQLRLAVRHQRAGLGGRNQFLLERSGQFGNFLVN